LIDVLRVDFVALPTTDMERAREFYRDTLGLSCNDLGFPRYMEVDTDNLSIGFYEPLKRGREFVPSSAPIALRVADVEAARKSLEGAGVTFDADTLDTSVCHMAFFRDPDGNALMLHRRYAPHADGREA
jgi:predicted enzyme related to lactoylglutathione lyase